MFFAHLALNANVVRENLKNGGECAGHSAETEAKAAKGVRHAQVQLAPRDRKLLPGSQEVQDGVRRACNTG